MASNERDIRNNEVKSNWEENAVAYFNALSKSSALRGWEKAQINWNYDIRFCGRDKHIQGLKDTKENYS
jgi:hypothetical protein